jgi:hypothetical protein
LLVCEVEGAHYSFTTMGYYFLFARKPVIYLRNLTPTFYNCGSS